MRIDTETAPLYSRPVFRSLLTAAFAAVFGLRVAAETPSKPGRSTVFFAHDPQAITQLEENARTTRRMVDRLVTAVTGRKEVPDAWRSLVSPKDRIGIKVSAAGGRYFATHVGVVQAIVGGLEQAGVPPAQITVWDRDGARLRAAGLVARRLGCEVRSLDGPRSYDADAKILAPVLGKLIWGDLLFEPKPSRRAAKGNREKEQLSSISHVATLLTRQITKVINVPVLADEAGCGIGGAIYNMTVPNVDNWRRLTQNEANQSGALPTVYADPHIAPKVVLHILDGLVAQYAGGPGGNLNYAFPHATVYASKDPIALDATALRLIEGWRKEAKLPAVGRRAEWLQAAEEMGLGFSRPESITLQSVVTSQ